MPAIAAWSGFGILIVENGLANVSFSVIPYTILD